MKETHKITVSVDGRKFICHMKDTSFLRIYERMTRDAGRPWECTFNRISWHFAHNSDPKRGLIRRVMDAASAINNPF